MAEVNEDTIDVKKRPRTSDAVFANWGLKRLARPKSRASSDSIQWKDLGRGSFVGYWPGAVAQKQHQHSFLTLSAEAPWRQSEVIMFGKSVMQPRRICYMADSKSLGYTYTGSKMEVVPWHAAASALRDVASEVTGEAFNSCLLNLYRDGSDYVGWHADDEDAYGPNATICSISLGHTRDFQLRCKADHGRKLTYSLSAGDLFVMKGTLQTYWQHAIPKRANVIQPRISLTFRTVKKPA